MENTQKSESAFHVLTHTSWSCKQISVFLLISLSMLVYGMAVGTSGVTLTMIKEHFDNSYDLQGFLLAISGFGYALFSFVTSLLLRYIGIRWVYIIGDSLLILCSIAMVFVDNFYGVCAIFLFTSFSNSLFDVGGNCTGTLLAKEHSGVIMHLIHFFYGLGSTLGPMYASALIHWFNNQYTDAYAGMAVLAGILIFYIIFVPLDIKPIEEGQKSTFSVLDSLKNKYVWIFAIFLSFFYIIELGVSSWGVLYLHDLYGVDPDTLGSTWLSVYFGLYTLSRLFSGFIVDKLGHFRSLNIGLGLTLIFYTIGFTVGFNGMWVIAVTGYFLAIIFPTIMCVGIDIFGSDVSNAMSITMTIAGLLSSCWHQVIGNINEHIGNVWGFRMILPICLLLIILLQVIYFMYKKDHTVNKQTEALLPQTSNNTDIESHPIESQ